MKSSKIPFFLFAFLLFISSFSCTNPDPTAEDPPVVEEETIEEEPIDEKYSFLALGDSYTIGQGVSMTGRWPVQLQSRLLTDSIIVDSLKIIAQTGWTTSNLLAAIEQQNPGKYDMVSLLIGVNNQYQGKEFSIYEEQARLLLDKAIELCELGAERVFVVSIPDYGVTPFAGNNASIIAEELDRYNTFMESECELRDIPFINITELSRMLGAENGALAADNLHPSAYQYSKWVDEITPVVKEFLE